MIEDLRGLKRLPDWEPRLRACLERLRERPHVYGQSDCLVGLAAGVVRAVTGRDPARGHRRKYRSQASAVRYLRSLGFASPEAMLDGLFEQKPIGFAQRGDLVLVRGLAMGWDIPAACAGGIALVLGDDEARAGLHPIPRPHWLKAWAVGHHHG